MVYPCLHTIKVLSFLHQQAVLWPRGYDKRLGTISSCVRCKTQMPPPTATGVGGCQEPGTDDAYSGRCMLVCVVCRSSCRLREPACRRCRGEHCTCVSLHNNKFDISVLCIEPAA